jgi:hypothetical protein
MAGVATMGAVYGLYQLNIGTTSVAQATDPNHPILESSRKKAGWTSFVAVSAIGLLAKDGNILTLGFGTIIAMELLYRHSIMAHPQTGALTPVSSGSYQPAENVVPLYQQGETA